jgi:uncharacterized membrane protein YjdF
VSFTFSVHDGGWWFKKCLEFCVLLLFSCSFSVVADLCEVVGAAAVGEAEKEAFLVGQRDRWCRVADLRSVFGVFGLSYLDALRGFVSAYAWRSEGM